MSRGRKPESILVAGQRFRLIPRRSPPSVVLGATENAKGAEQGTEYDYPPDEQACAACGRPMKPRMTGAPWHARCGREGGME